MVQGRKMTNSDPNEILIETRRLNSKLSENAKVMAVETVRTSLPFNFYLIDWP